MDLQIDETPKPSDEPYSRDFSEVDRLTTFGSMIEENLNDDGHFGAPNLIVPKLAWLKHVTMLAGREKSGKSTVLGAAVAAVTNGAPFLGHEGCGPYRTLYLNFEESVPELGNRLLCFGADPRYLAICQRPGGDRLKHLQEAVAVTNPSLIVIDSLTKLVNGNGPSPESNVGWDQAIDPIINLTRRSNAATLLSHHANKHNGKYRGSTAIGANVDVIVEMSANGPETVRQMTTQGRSQAPVEDFEYRFDPDADDPFPELT